MTDRETLKLLRWLAAALLFMTCSRWLVENIGVLPTGVIAILIGLTGIVAARDVAVAHRDA